MVGFTTKHLKASLDRLPTERGNMQTYEELVDEVNFLRFYMERAYDSFGPSDADIDQMIKEEYERRTGNKVPLQYKDEEDESN